MLFAIHISQGVLEPLWWQLGFAVLVPWCWLASRKMRDDEIPRIALLAAVFYVASTIHVPIGVSSVHLLLNGLVGVLLGPRAILAILIGVGLQAMFLDHGGRDTIGINTLILAAPALGAWLVFRLARRSTVLKSRSARGLLAALSGTVWVLSAILAAALLTANVNKTLQDLELTPVLDSLASPWTWLASALTFGLLLLLERQRPASPEFVLGLVIGEGTVLATVTIQAAVLLLGGVNTLSAVVLISVLAHLPLAVIEGLILGLTVGFLNRVKPELLDNGLVAPEASPNR